MSEYQMVEKDTGSIPLGHKPIKSQNRDGYQPIKEGFQPQATNTQKPLPNTGSNVTQPQSSGTTEKK